MSTVGLLPLYIQLYDDVAPDMRPGVERFYRTIANELEARGLRVLTCPVCRVKAEFERAIAGFEAGGAQAIVTLHLAYSPSLEASDALARTKLPLIVLDTTPDYRFDCTISAEAISYNHGIHGVQDMCNLLLRNGKPFTIFAGHWQKSDVLDRAAEAARMPGAAQAMRRARVGLVGEPFAGMGDFGVSEEKLRELGVTVSRYDMEKGARLARAVTREQLDAEYALDSERFDCEGVPRETYDATERCAQAVREWVREEGLSAFSMNFLLAGTHEGFATMPFAEACKAMSAGIGYAGEGDALTAALVGALLTAYPDASFAEMFCPDWEHGAVYFSHMGEFNLKAACPRPKMRVLPFKYAPAFDPACVKGRFKPGSVCLVNLAPTREGFRLVLAQGDMLALPESIGSFEAEVSGWFLPKMPLPDFLCAYSRAGGTHHSALCYGAHAEALALFARELGVEAVTL